MEQVFFESFDGSCFVKSSAFIVRLRMGLVDELFWHRLGVIIKYILACSVKSPAPDVTRRCDAGTHSLHEIRLMRYDLT